MLPLEIENDVLVWLQHCFWEVWSSPEPWGWFVHLSDENMNCCVSHLLLCVIKTGFGA